MRYGHDYPGLKGTGLDDINVLFGSRTPQAAEFPATANPVAPPPGYSQGHLAPSAAGAGSRDAGLKKKMEDRLKHLGY